MAVIEHLNEKSDIIHYRISDRFALCFPNAVQNLEVQVREIHEKNERVTKEALNLGLKERA